MKEFKDDEGRPWRVALTSASAARVRDMVTIEVADEDSGETRTVPFDIVDIGTISQTLQVLRSQFLKLSEILYAIVLQQVEERKLTKEQFLDGLRGDALDSAAKALEAELVDFFPQRLRPMVGLLAKKMDEVATELMGQAEAGLEKVTVSDLSGKSSGSVPESSASTQEIGPSASSSRRGKRDSSTIGGTQPI